MKFIFLTHLVNVLIFSSNRNRKQTDEEVKKNAFSQKLLLNDFRDLF